MNASKQVIEILYSKKVGKVRKEPDLKWPLQNLHLPILHFQLG